MDRPAEPFWDQAFRDDARPFGPPSAEVLELCARLPPCARVLDLGCGDGRNALPLAAAGHRVTGVDISKSGIEALRRRADAEGLEMEIVTADLRTFSPAGLYDLVIAHGVLHLLPRPERDRLIRRVMHRTRAGGWNVMAVFTTAIDPPPDLADLCCGLFVERELLLKYRGWEVEHFQSYVLEDEHPGGIRHRHPINKLVARRRLVEPRV